MSIKLYEETAFPGQVLKRMKVEMVIPDTYRKDTGIAVLSKKRLRSNKSLIRIFAILSSEQKELYKLDQELQHFIFIDDTSAQAFMEQLPKMTAIELLYVMRENEQNT
jgi:hypothetical protein